MSNALQLLGLAGLFYLIKKASATNHRSYDPETEDLLLEPLKPAKNRAWSNQSELDFEKEPNSYGTNKHWSEIIYDNAKFSKTDRVDDWRIISPPSTDVPFMISRRSDDNLIAQPV
jgi:hypothetical protein